MRGARGSAWRSARSSLNPRDRRVTRENVPLADVLEGYPAISRVRAASERYGRRSGGAGAVERGVRPVRDRPPCGCPRRRQRHGPHRSGRPPSPAGPRRRRLSKSATKTPTEPERRKRIVDIPRFCSPPIPPRGAFVADLDTTSPRVAPGAPPATRRHPRITFRVRTDHPRRPQERGPSFATPLSFCYAPSPFTVRGKGA